MDKPGRVALRVFPRDSLRLTVSDEGPGIPVEVQDKIYNLYFTTKGRGSGIGLAMTYRIVQLHNASVDFTTEAGKGTVFEFRFPAYSRREGKAAFEAVG
jgi:signal transduction histidine kinase